MFFFFSKVLNFLAQPLVIVVLLLITSWLIRNHRWKKIFRVAGFATLLIFCNYFISNALIRAWELPIKPYESIHKTYDYGVLLTGVTKTNMMPKDRVYFSRGADRATHTLQLWKLGIIKKIIVSGGSGRLDGSGVREADDLADFLKMAGVPDSVLIIENESKNTRESAVNVSALLKNLDGSKDVLLVTSGYHLRRSIACFRKVGINVDPFSTDPVSEPVRFSIDHFLVPRADSIMMWQIMLKEWIGFVAYWLAGFI